MKYGRIGGRAGAAALAVLLVLSMLPVETFAGEGRRLESKGLSVTGTAVGSQNGNEATSASGSESNEIDGSEGGAPGNESSEIAGSDGSGSSEIAGSGSSEIAGSEGGGTEESEGGGSSHIHSMEYIEREDATCRKSGVEAYYHCTGCGRKFSDTAGEEEITNQEELIIPIREHDWDDGKISPDDPLTVIYTCKTCGTTKSGQKDSDPDPTPTPDPDPTPMPDPEPTPTPDPEPTPAPDPDPEPQLEKLPEAKSIKLNGNSLKFKKKVVTDQDKISYMDAGRVERIWLKAAKSKMTVNWKTASSMKFMDGVIILRKTGNASAYKEIAEIPFRTGEGDGAKWAPKKKYTDKSASARDTPYSYVLVSYQYLNGQRLISHCSDWAAGQTDASAKKTVNTAAVSTAAAKLQYKGSVKLSIKYGDPKATYNAKSFRWYSDNKKVAKVNQKGKVTAAGVGSTTVRARLSSGDDVTCKVTVKGAFKPGTPKIKIESASDSAITVSWSKARYATSYEVYRSDDGLHWKDPVKTDNTSYTFKKLTKGHRYTFYVSARNDNHGYSAVGDNSSVINQKAVNKQRKTKVTGFPEKKTLTSGTAFEISIKVTSPDCRKASVQLYENKKWVTKKTVTLPKGSGTKTVKVLFPNDWWGKTSSWRIVIPESSTSGEFTTAALKIKTKRRYQNPKDYIQIKNTISSHGYGHYVAEVLIDDASTRDDCIGALLRTANKYLGDPYAAGKTNAPGKGIDAGGLVIEACYGAGIDLWPVSPSTRETNVAPAIMKSKLKNVASYGKPTESDFPDVYRGDLIFFKDSKGKVAHVAIYRGYGDIIHASKVSGKVEQTKLTTIIDKKGKYKYTIAGVKRVFA